MPSTAVISTLLVSVMLGAAHGAPTPPSENLLLEAYPQVLVAAGEGHQRFDGGALRRRVAYAVVSDDSSPALVVAAYSDGRLGAVRLLRIGGAGPEVLGEYSRLLEAGAGKSEVMLRDVTGDSHAEVIVVFSDHRGADISYVFELGGSAFNLISPVLCGSNSYVRSALIAPTFVDFDGDAVDEIIDVRTIAGTSDSDGDVEYRLLRRDASGIYRRSADGYFFGSFARETGPPTSEAREFVLSAPALGMLWVANGASDGTARVSSAEVRLNGNVVLRQQQFNQNVSGFRSPIQLAARNRLEVRLTGAPKSWITVFVAADDADAVECDVD